MNTGLDLWKKATNIIPGGNGLLSKRPERYLPDKWPTYFTKAKGVTIYDLDGNRYIDMANMGLGTAILGYSDDYVDTAVKQCIDKGVNTTLNAPEEVSLAERLLELNTFADGVKFARTGGEAMSVAVRIARAKSKRDKVAFSGYHGWCDWYIAANLGDKDNLCGHLLPGLEPAGVPKALSATVFPFAYNKPEALYDIMDKHDIGVIVIEGARYDFPTKKFLEAIWDIGKQRDIIIVVDEITSGWRMSDGGVYKLTGFTPDIVVYGKAMGNGYAISAVVGKKDVMEAANESFMSSTFWTERVGFVAALSTIERLVEHRVWEHLNKIGTIIGDGWMALGQKHNIRLEVTEFKPLIAFKLHYEQDNPALYTLFTQEMLKRGYLATSNVYVSYAHDEGIVLEYMKSVDEVFAIMAQAIREDEIYQRLESSVKIDAFKRLT